MPNRSSKPKRPRDTNQLAKFITELATGEIEMPKTDEGKDPAAVALGRKGGLKGGKARAESMTAKQRAEIAKKAAKSRWASKSSKQDT
jgi:hypothetical protein